MKLNVQSPLLVLLFSIILIFQFACSKDSDLLAEYVLAETQDAIDFSQLVIDDTFFIASSGSVTLDVLANDTLESQEEVVITETSEPNSGTVEINSDNTLTYTPETTEETVDTFTYSTEVVNEDETVSTESATVTVNVKLPQDGNSGPLKAFPSAFGGGSNATGGRGKALAIITTLNPEASLTHHAASGDHDEYYTGGLYAAMQKNSVGYIVFNVSGNIDLGNGGTGSRFGFNGIPGVNDKTIFGQSAPEGGITLTGGTFRLDGANGNNRNLIFRYFRSRPIYDKSGTKTAEDDAYTWSFLFFGGENVIVDHCTASFAQDKAMGAFINSGFDFIKNFTFSNNFIQDSGTGVYIEINPNREGDPENNVDLVSCNKNVIVSVNRTPNLAFSGRAEKLNNVIFDTPSKQSSVYHDLRLNEIGNYYIGSDKKNKIREDIISNENSGAPLIYSNYNYFEGILSGKSSENNQQIWTLRDGTTLASNQYFTSQMHNGFPNEASILTPGEAYSELITNGNVGAYKYLDGNGVVRLFRDSYDISQLSLVAESKNYTAKNIANWVLPQLPNNTRPDEYDSDKDGMSDAWELRMFGDLSQSYRDDYDGDGYENIEEYMNQVDL